MKLDLQKFAGSLTVTIIKDNNSHWTAASASPASSLAKDDAVALTVTPATGYELDEIEVIAGGVTITKGVSGYGFVMGEADVTLFFKSKADNLYKIVENTFVSVNGSVTRLQRNMMLKRGKNGAVVGVDCTPTAITLSADLVNALLESGAIIKV